MRKLVICLAVLVSAFAVKAELRSSSDIAGMFILYVPNRILDALDIFSISASAGLQAGLELRATRACDGGGRFGAAAEIAKDYNRQYGAGVINGWNTSFICFAAEDTIVGPTTRWLKSYRYCASGIPLTTEKVYNIYTGPRDYWECSAEGSLLLGLRGALHPIEFFDFWAGLVFIDLKGDDLSLDDF
jgi:hypothetical protein